MSPTRMSHSPSIVWFRHDLRLADNPALEAAIEEGRAVLPVFIWEPDEEYPWEPGAASRWWLHHSLKALDARLAESGSRLILRTGPTLGTLRSLIKETGAEAVYWNRRYEPRVLERDRGIEDGLRESGIHAESFNGSLLFEPGEIRTKQNNVYRVFTPYWKACRKRDIALPTPAPKAITSPKKWPKSRPLDDLGLLPTIDWAAGMGKAWTPGEAGALTRFGAFIDEHITGYVEGRNRPDQAGTSSLSPHLHFGEISPRILWHRILAGAEIDDLSSGAETYLKEIAWREFGHQLLHHFPKTTDEPLRGEFAAFPWRKDPKALRAWQRGRTGYPIVDAGMRQLWATGWMHNRVRMIVASFLVKHLLLPWQDGARWFWDTLVDADLANNTLGWQWSAGCGADAAPYFRVFNPILQGEKYDPNGEYVRRWVPELAKVPDRYLHKPWEAPAKMLGDSGITLGTTYPRPIVEHSAARERALEAFYSTTKSEET